MSVTDDDVLRVVEELATPVMTRLDDDDGWAWAGFKAAQDRLGVQPAGQRTRLAVIEVERRQSKDRLGSTRLRDVAQLGGRIGQPSLAMIMGRKAS